MKIKRRFLEIKHPRRFIIITASIIVGLGLIAYGILSYFAWKGIDDYSKNAGAFLKQTIDEELGAKKEDSTSREKVATILGTFRAKYSSTDCSTNGLYAWQTVIPSANDVKSGCETRSASITAVTTSLEDLVGFYEDQEQTAALTQEAFNATKDAADYGAASDKWLWLMSAPVVVNKHAPFTPVTQKIISVAEGLRDAYSALNTANASKNKQTFDAALTNLTAAYARVSEIQSATDAELQKLVDTLLERYAAL